MIPFSPPKIYDELIDEVVDTLKSGWITTGPKTKLFEQEISNYCGNPKTLCLNSATAGLEVMLRWYGVGEGDEVIIPVYTYCATANTVVHCGAKPVFVDVASDFNIALDQVKSAITDRTKVIMPVDFGGYPCDYDALNKLVHSHAVKQKFKASTVEQQHLGRILIISDAAHSFGASYKGKRTGTLTDVSVFSFHAVKNLTTAEGGAIALNLPQPFDNEAIYKALCISTLHGQSKDALAKSQKGAWKYDVVEAGYKANMTDIQASLGLVELRRYDKETLVRRKEIFRQYTQGLKQREWAELPSYFSTEGESSYHLFALRIKGITEAQRDVIMDRIFAREVAVNVHFQPLPLLSFYKQMGYDILDYPVAYDNYSREISLPVYYDLTDEQVQTVIKAVIESVEEVLHG